MQERWRLVEDCPLYRVSDTGQVKHYMRDQIRTPQLNASGFPTVALSQGSGGPVALRQVNRLVLKAFGAPPDYPDQTAVWHIDGDLTNCSIDNLVWERRDRVLEWNKMHRDGVPRLDTPRVMDLATRTIYRDAYECGIRISELESTIVYLIEHYESQQTRFIYV